MSMAIQLRCFFALLCADMWIFRKEIVDRFINLFIWGATTTISMGYILPVFGLSEGYGAVVLVGILASAGVFDTYGRVALLVTEMTDEQPIYYYATLPISTPLMVLRITISNALRAAIVGLGVLPLGKLLLGSSLSFAHTNVGALCCIFIVSNLFYGAYSVWLACHVPTILDISNAWMRFVYPLWFLGGFQFSRAALVKSLPLIAYLNTFNPMMYIYEGTRAAVLGNEGYLNVWLCIGVMTFFWAITLWRAIVCMRTRLNLL